MGAAVIGLFIYISFSSTESNLKIDKIGELYSNKIAGIFSGIQLSKTLLYTILVVPFMVLVQVGVLKNYFDKKYEL